MQYDSSASTPQAEQLVLGAILLDNTCIDEVLDRICPADFKDRKHARIYQAMLQALEQDAPIDEPSLLSFLGQDADSVGGGAYLAQLRAAVGSTANIRFHADLIRRARHHRDMIAAGNRLIKAGREACEDPSAAIDATVSELLDLTRPLGDRAIGNLRDELGPAFTASEEASRSPNGLLGLSTGFPTLDSIIGGLKQSNLLILAARPSKGKSALAMNIAVNVLKATQERILVFALEMSSRELTYRIAAREGQLNSRRLMCGKLTKEEWSRYSTACGDLQPFAERLLLVDHSLLTPATMRSHLRRESRRQRLGLVIVDYLQLMSGDKKYENRTQEITAISRSLKILARDFDTPILVLSQLSRAVEQRTDSIPKLSDLRDSGSIEQDADVVMFIHRPKDSSEASIIVDKQRNGPTGTVLLNWNAESVCFHNHEGG